jgi:uncharacterized protein (TIGR00251 family)
LRNSEVYYILKILFILMRITVDVKPKAKKDNVELIEKNHYMVHTRAPASKGKANVAVTKLLKKHIGKPVMIISGHTSSRKHFIVEE